MIWGHPQCRKPPYLQIGFKEKWAQIKQTELSWTSRFVTHKGYPSYFQQQKHQLTVDPTFPRLEVAEDIRPDTRAINTFFRGRREQLFPLVIPIIPSSKDIIKPYQLVSLASLDVDFYGRWCSAPGPFVRRF